MLKSLCSFFFLIHLSVTVYAQDSITTDSTIWWDEGITIQHGDFNQGNYAHGWGLIRGQLPGLLIAKPGAELNNTYQVRLRGQSSFFSPVAPLVVIDGVIGSSIDAIDPMNIASFEVLGPTEAARYGMQGSNGVIEIRTHHPKKSAFSVSAQYFHAFEFKNHKQKSLDAVTYRSLAESINFMGDTDWMEAITQTGSTDLASLRISGSQKIFDYRFLVNGRSRSGILKNTDAQRFTVGSSLSGQFFGDVLKVNYSGHFRREKRNPGLAEAFKYALISNPTLSVRDANGDFNERDLFDAFNPVAMVELASLSDEETSQNHHLRASLNVGKTSISGYYGLYHSTLHHKEDYPNQLKFRSELARNDEYRYQTNQFGISIDRSFNLGPAVIQSTLSHRYQEIDQEWEFVFMNPSQTNINSDRQLIKLASYDASASLRFQQVFIDGAFNLEGSSALAADEKFQSFYQINTGVNLGSNISSFSDLVLKAGYAKTGLTPYRSGLSKLTYLRDSAEPNASHNANPNLKNEETHTLSLSINGSSKNEKLQFRTLVYRAVSKDLIGRFFVDQEIASSTYANFGEIQNAGFELMVNYAMIKSNAFQWSSALNFSTYRNRVTKLGGPSDSFSDLVYSYPGAPGFGSTNLFKLETGKRIGTFIAPFVEGISPNGEWMFRDMDGDGSYCNCPDDQSTNLGSGYPTYSFGWSNQLTLKKFSFSFLVRSVGGHQLVNMNRMFYQGPTQTNLNNYNVLTSFGELRGINNPQTFSDFYIEDGAYTTLEYMTISYKTELDKLSARFFLTGNNLITLSGYSGNSPELRLLDTGTGSNGGYLSAQYPQLSLGLDRRTEWLPSKSLVLGVEVTF